MTVRPPPILVAACLTTATAWCAFAQQPIRVRTLTTPVATDSGVFRAITSIRSLSDGRVIVNDASRKRLLMFAPNLRTFTTLADTAASAPSRYPLQRQAGIFPFLGDSTIFVDTEAQVLVVIDPSGKFGRAMASPTNATDFTLLAATVYGTPGFDPKGRLIYRGLRQDPPGTRPDLRGVIEAARTTPQLVVSKPDSSPIVRADFDTRMIDTIGYMRLPVANRIVDGNSIQTAFNPLPLTDEWALLPGGSVAVVRYNDYHLDIWNPDGTKFTSPRIPYDWKRITLEERQALLDSVKHADSLRMATLPPPPPSARGAAASVRRPIYTVKAEEMWDFYPPVRGGQVKVDRDGNIWILPSTSSAAGEGLVFDVVRRDGTLVERVRLPSGRNLIGFGPDQSVFMIYAPSPERILLERARVVR